MQYPSLQNVIATLQKALKSDIFMAQNRLFMGKMECAKLIDENVAIIDKLKAQKVKCGKTSQQIAKDANLSESTVTRIFSGKTPNPTVAIVIAMWKAMGGTATELFDDTVKVDVVSETPQVVMPTVDVNVYNQMIEMYKDIIVTKDESFNKTIKQKDRWIKLLFVLLFFFMLLAAIFIGVDLSTGEFGLFRY